ncbi:uncharacterized [Tachysurus ichikawai]
MSFDVVSIRSVARPCRVIGRHTFLLSSRLTRCIKDKPIPPGLIHSLHSFRSHSNQHGLRVQAERSSVTTECSSGISHSLLSTCRSVTSNPFTQHVEHRMSSNPSLLNPFAPEKQPLAFYFRIPALSQVLIRTMRLTCVCEPANPPGAREAASEEMDL